MTSVNRKLKPPLVMAIILAIMLVFLVGCASGGRPQRLTNTRLSSYESINKERMDQFDGTTSQPTVVSHMSNNELVPERSLQPPTVVNGRQILVSGPVDIEVFDQEGNRTGLGLTESDPIEVNATKTTYRSLGDTKSIFVRGRGIYVANIIANEGGVFDLRLETSLNSGGSLRVHFLAVPFSSANSRAKLIYNADEDIFEIDQDGVIKTKDELEIDQDGDGVFETKLLPNQPPGSYKP